MAWYIKEQRDKMRCICTRADGQELRSQYKDRLADTLLGIVGTRTVKGRQYVTSEDITMHAREVLALRAELALYFTAKERKALLRTRLKRPELALARVVLKAVGHPMSASNYRYPLEGVPAQCRKTVSKYLLLSLADVVDEKEPHSEPAAVCSAI